MQGGTFTVNNTGSFGSILSYPIINYPQAAILTFESIVKKPVVINDMIAVRSMANMCLSLDHRILDGVICGRFLQRVKENLKAIRSIRKCTERRSQHERQERRLLTEEGDIRMNGTAESGQDGRRLRVHHLGFTDYGEAWELQKAS